MPPMPHFATLADIIIIDLASVTAWYGKSQLVIFQQVWSIAAPNRHFWHDNCVKAAVRKGTFSYKGC